MLGNAIRNTIKELGSRASKVKSKVSNLNYKKATIGLAVVTTAVIAAVVLKDKLCAASDASIDVSDSLL